MRTKLPFLLALSITSAAATAFAETAQIGIPAHPIAISLAENHSRAELRIANLRVALDLPFAGASISAQSVTVEGGANVVVVSAVNGDTRAAALIVEHGGRPRALWTGRTDLHGDFGERRGQRIETRDRTGDGVADVLVGEVQENIRLCGQSPALLFARGLDPSTMQLRPVALMPFDVPQNIAPVEAVLTSPGPAGAPRVPTLRIAAASSIAGVAENPSALTPPRVLEDPTRGYWSEGRGGVGRGEFVTADLIIRGLPVHAVALTLSPVTPPRGQALARPTSVWLVGNTGAPMHVRLPEAPAGQRVWIRLPAPAHWSCMSVVLDEAVSADPAHQDGARVSLAGIEAYSELDFGGRLETFIAALDEPGVPGENALAAVRAFGNAAVDPLLASFDRLADLGKMRALELLSPVLESNATARAAAVRAVNSPSETLQRNAVTALVRAGTASRRELASIVETAGPLADRVAASLAQNADADVMNTFLGALTASGGSERPALRQAIIVAASRNPAARGALASWASATPPLSAAAALAAAFRTGDGDALEVAHVLVDMTYAHAEGFPDRYRIARAATLVGRDPGLTEWLVQQALHAEEWMQRDAALTSLHARHSPELVAAATAALADAYPRVRANAIAVLPINDESAPKVSALAHSDTWPMVRSAALTALAAAHRGADEARHALQDSQPQVRAAAIRALTELGIRDAWTQIAAMLMNEQEWPEVLEAALVFARTQCVTNATDPIVAVLHRGLRPNSWAPDQELTGLALNVAVTLGGDVAEEALQIATRESSPASLRGEAARLQAHPPATCTPP